MCALYASRPAFVNSASYGRVEYRPWAGTICKYCLGAAGMTGIDGSPILALAVALTTHGDACITVHDEATIVYSLRAIDTFVGNSAR
jgi:hypothetical protein